MRFLKKYSIIFISDFCKRLQRRQNVKNIERYIDPGIEVLFHVIICGVLCFLIVGFLHFQMSSKQISTIVRNLK